MQNLFCEGLLENDIAKLLEVPKSDIHNHSTKGCRRAWLEEHLKRRARLKMSTCCFIWRNSGNIRSCDRIALCSKC